MQIVTWRKLAEKETEEFRGRKRNCKRITFKVLQYVLPRIIIGLKVNGGCFFLTNKYVIIMRNELYKKIIIKEMSHLMRLCRFETK